MRMEEEQGRQAVDAQCVWVVSVSILLETSLREEDSVEILDPLFFPMTHYVFRRKTSSQGTPTTLLVTFNWNFNFLHLLQSSCIHFGLWWTTFSISSHWWPSKWHSSCLALLNLLHLFCSLYLSLPDASRNSCLDMNNFDGCFCLVGMCVGWALGWGGVWEIWPLQTGPCFSEGGSDHSSQDLTEYLFTNHWSANFPQQISPGSSQGKGQRSWTHHRYPLICPRPLSFRTSASWRPWVIFLSSTQPISLWWTVIMSRVSTGIIYLMNCYWQRFLWCWEA